MRYVRQVSENHVVVFDRQKELVGSMHMVGYCRWMAGWRETGRERRSIKTNQLPPSPQDTRGWDIIKNHITVMRILKHDRGRVYYHNANTLD